MNDAWTDVLRTERRRDERLQPHRQVSIRCIKGVKSVFGWGDRIDVPAILDLSARGARLEANEDPELGSILCLDLETGDGGSFEVLGEVRWIRAGSSAGAGFECGVEFFNFIPSQRREIHDLCLWAHGDLEEISSSSRSSIPA